MIKFNDFSRVEGYATYDNARKRGEFVASQMPSDVSYRWSVIALPSGRFAPMIILNNTIPGGPGMFLHYKNVCLSN